MAGPRLELERLTLGIDTTTRRGGHLEARVFAAGTSVQQAWVRVFWRESSGTRTLIEASLAAAFLDESDVPAGWMPAGRAGPALPATRTWLLPPATPETIAADVVAALDHLCGADREAADVHVESAISLEWAVYVGAVAFAVSGLIALVGTFVIAVLAGGLGVGTWLLAASTWLVGFVVAAFGGAWVFDRLPRGRDWAAILWTGLVTLGPGILAVAVVIAAG